MSTTIWSRLMRLSATLLALVMLSSIMMACGGDDDDDDDVGTTADATNTLGAVSGTPEGGDPTPTTDTFNTPLPTGSIEVEASPDASPGRASPDASPTAMEPVDLATAFENLLAQPSYVIGIDIEDLPAVVEAVPQVEESLTMRLEVANDDRHLTIMTIGGTTLLELWLVDDEVFVDAGEGPMSLEDADTLGLSDAVVGQLFNAPEALIGVLSTAEAGWEVTGQAEVNDFMTTVQEASYEATGIPDTIYFDTDEVAIDARMWVEQDEHFLVQLNADVTEGGAAEQDGTPVTGSPEAESASHIFIDVVSVGDVEEIEVPASN